MTDPMDAARESLDALNRIVDVVQRSEAIGNPRAIVDVADLTTLLAVVRGSTTPAADEALRFVNSWVDQNIDEVDRELGGVPSRARRSWNEFEASGGAQAASLPTQALTLVRIGYIAGYPFGWFDRDGRRP